MDGTRGRAEQLRFILVLCAIGFALGAAAYLRWGIDGGLLYAGLNGLLIALCVGLFERSRWTARINLYGVR